MDGGVADMLLLFNTTRMVPGARTPKHNQGHWGRYWYNCIGIVITGSQTCTLYRPSLVPSSLRKNRAR